MDASVELTVACSCHSGTMRAITIAAASLLSLRRMLPGGVDFFTHWLCVKSNDKLAL